jgi:hypothetical protein
MKPVGISATLVHRNETRRNSRIKNGIQEVGGSIPPGSTTQSSPIAVFSPRAEYVVVAET